MAARPDPDLPDAAFCHHGSGRRSRRRRDQPREEMGEALSEKHAKRLKPLVVEPLPGQAERLDLPPIRLIPH